MDKKDYPSHIKIKKIPVGVSGKRNQQGSFRKRQALGKLKRKEWLLKQEWFIQTYIARIK